MPCLTIPDTKIRTLYQDAFPLCAGNSIMAIANGGAYSPLIDFLGLEATTADEQIIGTVSYIGPAGTSATAGIIPWVDDACGVRTGIESGNCRIRYKGFGRLGIQTENRDIMSYNDKLCDVEPIYTVGGTRITDELTYDWYRGAKVIVNALHGAIVTGNKGASTSQFDGLERLVNYNYTDYDTGERCTSQDSVVVNYNSQAACPSDQNPPTGVTWNGVARPDVQNLTQVIEEIVNYIVGRVAMAGLGAIQTGNIVIICPNSMIRSLIDCYICSRYCNNNAEGLKSSEAREWYDRIISQGGFGTGVLQFGSVQVPILPYDFGLIKTATTSDIYVLTNGVGNTPFTRLQYKDARLAEQAMRARGNMGVMSSDDGKVLITNNGMTGTCTSWNMDSQFRLILRAPWAQARIQNVAYTGLAPLYSMDPTSTYYVETNKVPHPETVTP